MSASQTPPTTGDLFRQLRELRGISSVRTAATRMGLSHTRLQDIENSPGPVSMRTGTAAAMARTYSVPVSLIHQIAAGALEGLPDDLVNPTQRTADRTRQEDRSLGRIRPVRFLGPVSGGLDGNGVVQPIGYLSIADFFLANHNPDHLYAVEVTGDSMVSDDLKLSYPPGTIVLVHENMAPQNGQVVVAWLERQEMAILKKFKIDNGTTWLVSHNPKYPPMLIDEDSPATVRGVMVSFWAKAPGL